MQLLLEALGASQKQGTVNNSVSTRLILKSKRYNTAAIRKLLNEAFEDEDLMSFVYDYFLPLYEQIIPSMTKNQKIQKIIEYADGEKQFDQLLDQIARERPRQYRRFADQLEIIE